MRVENLQNQLKYLEGGLDLIKKDLKEIRKRFIKLQFTPNNIKQYKKTKSDYKLVSNSIKCIKNMLKDEKAVINS